jgi:hypothetical protein
MTGTRRYTEREVVSILRLAGKLDAGSGAQTASA